MASRPIDLPPPPPAERLARAAALARDAPVPARVGRIRVGTAGWTDPTLIASRRFYPRHASTPEARLRFYASQFPMVELDGSYYALPSYANAERWVARTPDGFLFNVKAYAPLTGHPFEPSRMPRDLLERLDPDVQKRTNVSASALERSMLNELWRRFLHALEPLRVAKRFGVVLLQYPPWFSATKGNAKTLTAAREHLGDVGAAVEFRHPSWGEPERFDRVMTLLRELRMSYVVVDEPQGTPHSMPPHIAVADPALAIVRFHGHTREWATEGVSVHRKFGYLYEPSELEPWRPTLRRLEEQAEEVHAVFNNCMSNFAILGAKDIAALLSEPTTP